MKINPVNLYSYSFCAKKKNDGSSESRAKDISVLDGKKAIITLPYQDGMFSLVGFVKIDKEAQIKGLALGAIDDGYSKYRHLLRDMQYNGGDLSEDEKERLRREYNLKHNILKEASFEKFPNEESYIEDKINKINQNLKDQMDDVDSLKPIDKPIVLYRGIKNPEDYTCDDSHQGEFSKTMLSLKPEDEVVLDWAPMCTSPSFHFAIGYGDDKNLMRIKLPEGAKVGLYNDNEVRLPSKSKFRFKGKDNHFGLNIWDFEYLGPKDIE